MNDGEIPDEFVLRMANEKALHVAAILPEGKVVIAADTIVLLDQKVLGKPVDESEAYKMLELLSGKTHKVLTAFCIALAPDKVLHSEICTTEVDIEQLVPGEIQSYIKTKEPMDKAGSYAIQGIGAFMVKEIRGSYTNVVGLPVLELLKALKKLELIEFYI